MCPLKDVSYNEVLLYIVYTLSYVAFFVEVYYKLLS